MAVVTDLLAPDDRSAKKALAPFRLAVLATFRCLTT
jgi:hypothetical protein